jgi:hypothetical protein
VTPDQPDSTKRFGFVPSGDLDVNNEVIVRLALV